MPIQVEPAPALVVPRPDEGLVTRPNTGVITRPNTGTLTRPQGAPPPEGPVYIQ